MVVRKDFKIVLSVVLISIYMIGCVRQQVPQNYEVSEEYTFTEVTGSFESSEEQYQKWQDYLCDKTAKDIMENLSIEMVWITAQDTAEGKIIEMQYENETEFSEERVEELKQFIATTFGNESVKEVLVQRRTE